MNLREANDLLRAILHVPRGRAPASVRSYMFDPAHANRTQALYRAALLAIVAWADSRATHQLASTTDVAADRLRIESWNEQGGLIRASFALAYGGSRPVRERAMMFVRDTGKGANLQIDYVHPDFGNCRDVLTLTEAARGADGLWRFESFEKTPLSP